MIDRGSSEDVRALCARLTRGGPVTAGALAAARRHGLHLLLAESLIPRERGEAWAGDLLRELRSAAVLAQARGDALQRMLASLAARQVDALLFKGAALAWTVYPAPHVRPRVDADVLIEREALDDADRAVRDDGWTRDVEADAELASAQRHYTRAIGPGRVERLDLHWRLVNPLPYARGLSVQELRSRAVPIPALGPAARTLSAPDTLFACCVHLVAHHPGNERGRLLWLFDIHLVAGALTTAERQAFLALAARTRMCEVCRSPIAAAAEAFGGRAASELARDLAAAHPARDGTLAVPAPPVVRVWRDLAALDGWRARVTLMSEHLFPSLRYLRMRYPRLPGAVLPLVWAHRIVRGAPKWFRTPGQRD